MPSYNNWNTPWSTSTNFQQLQYPGINFTNLFNGITPKPSYIPEGFVGVKRPFAQAVTGVNLKVNNDLSSKLPTGVTSQIDLSKTKFDKETKSSLNGGAKGGWNGDGTAIETGINIGNLLSNASRDDSKYDTSAEQTALSAIGKLGPYGKVAEWAGNAFLSLNSNIDALTGKVTKDQADEIGISNAARIANNVGSFISNLVPGVGKLAQRADELDDNLVFRDFQNSYSGTANSVDTMKDTGGKRHWGSKVQTTNTRLNDNINTITSLGLDQKKRSSSIPINSQLYNSQNMNQYQSNPYSSIAFGREGVKLLSKAELELIKQARNPQIQESVEAFGEGGKLGIDTNIIPEGALHATKNHLEEANPEMDEVTTKGIPVIVTDENGDYEQVAEIEREELVLTKELTEKIEELWRDGSEEAMIEVGKILAEELVTNTEDLNGNNKD